jgi:anti-anti-sigma factor
MITSPLTVTLSSDGQICVLAASGELDFTNAARFGLCAASALEDGPDRLVLDLAGLDFLDRAGAFILDAAVQAVPPGCPVIVRAISPFAARLLEMLGLELERPPASTAAGPQAVAGAPPGPAAPSVPDAAPAAGAPSAPDAPPAPDAPLAAISPPDPPGDEVPALTEVSTRARAQVISLDLARTRRRMVRAAQQIAVTEERIATTFARLAAQRPDQADQLRAASRSARAYATRTRRWARSHQALLTAAPRPPAGGPGPAC